MGELVDPRHLKCLFLSGSMSSSLIRGTAVAHPKKSDSELGFSENA